MSNPHATIDDAQRGAPSAGADEAPPRRIGRYRIERLLGEGGFGQVFLAHDEQLSRPVAIKVPHAHLVAEGSDADAYLAEARTVANLDHPNIVPVFDVGSTDQFHCYVVSKYIDGSSLKAKASAVRLSPEECADVVATVAEALHYAHKQGIVHRDIKPGNLLLDRSGKPFVADFGLALREQDVGNAARCAGTPAYMSPEQARGEGHRVDGRSDIFSLGVVLYELLAGKRPFEAESQTELLQQVIRLEARPLRQIDDRIPRELDRICLKALSKRASERYAVARDMADDLRHWLRPLSEGRDGGERVEGWTSRVEPELPAASGQPKDAFLSYASPDKEAAFELCRALEEQGIACWIAPRDVPPGADYGEAIIRAIEGTKATFLLLSAHANGSVHVSHEVERATSKRKRVIPVRLQNVTPSTGLELHLATSQWVDAWRLSPAQVAAQLALVIQGQANQSATVSRTGDTLSLSSRSGQRALKIVPKGLRSFDAHDADFYLELLPGPRDRDGLPESIRFWKTHLESTDPDGAFSVGLIYGPSGCGKSSLVRAGLLPRLAQSVKSIYVEATADETEARLLRGLRRQVPALAGELGLIESLAAFRRGRYVESGQKVVLVLDQFEQWLHARHSEENTELVRALRHCDGAHVQCIVMVRDDFWMAATRFMRELEIRLVEGENSAAVDLFPVRHAEKVLTAFGRAFGTIPEKSSELTKEQRRFIEQCARGLAQDGKVICVRLALFAEMMKGKSWVLASLHEVGGTTGVGLTFLEETFSADTAPPEHRFHQKAARAVLKALLPEPGAKIKGHMRSYVELLQASGYAGRPRDFDDLIRILDSEIRLITPTDPEGAADENDPASKLKGDQKYYQLAHDYLVHSLRDWLTRKQKETARGRAELALADRASVWTARQESRQLPSLPQWLSIQLLTHKGSWSAAERRMMTRATYHHLVRSAILAVLVASLAATGLVIRRQVLEHRKGIQAGGLVRRLLDANIALVPGIVKDIDPYRKWADPLLKEEHDKGADGSRQKLRISLALLPVDPTQADYLFQQVLASPEPETTLIIRDSLLPYKESLISRLWPVLLQSESSENGGSLRAAALLASFDPLNPQWGTCGEKVAQQLVSESPIYLGTWTQAFAPVKAPLIRPLSRIFRNPKARESERTLATNILAEYAGDNPNLLADLLMDGDDKQFAVLFPKLSDHRDRALLLLSTELNKQMPANATEKDRLAKRQASAAVGLLRLGETEMVWTRLKFSPDPGVRSYLVHRLGFLGADPRIIIKRLDEEKDLFIQRALILSLGEFTEDRFSARDRQALMPRLLALYRDHPDPGIHSAAEWLLRGWDQDKTIKQVENQWAKDPSLREKRLRTIGRELAQAQTERSPRWYVNGQGQTIVVLAGPTQFLMGSPPTEVGRKPDEVLHRQGIRGSFGISAKSVTIEQYTKFRKDYKYYLSNAPTRDCPAHAITWYMAAAYCNWLSKEEGLPTTEWCYEPNPKNGKYEAGMRLAPNYQERTGYRLPTEAEWEYACRAGTVTSRYYGESEELLEKYAWYIPNSNDRLWPVGSLKPNDWGLFDMLGNVYSWCQDREKPYMTPRGGAVAEDIQDTVPVTDKDLRELRGHCFGNRGFTLRAAMRWRFVPTYSPSGLGFRVARTIR